MKPVHSSSACLKAGFFFSLDTTSTGINNHFPKRKSDCGDARRFRTWWARMSAAKMPQRSEHQEAAFSHQSTNTRGLTLNSSEDTSVRSSCWITMAVMSMFSVANTNSTLFTLVCYKENVLGSLSEMVKWKQFDFRHKYIHKYFSHNLSSSQLLLQPGLLLYISHADAVTWISTFSSCLCCSQIFKYKCSRWSLFFPLKSLNAALAYWSLSYWTLTVCSKFYGGIFISACTDRLTLILSKDCYQWLYHYCVTTLWLSN